MTPTNASNEDSIIEVMRTQIRTTPLPNRRPALIAGRGLSRGIPGYGQLLGAGSAVLGVTLLIAVGVLNSDNAPPATAATLNPNGTVTITLRELSGVGKLNARLMAIGTRIRAVPVVRGCRAPVREVVGGRVVPGPPRTLNVSSQRPGAVVTLTIRATPLRPGRTFVVAATRSGLQGIDVVVQGPAPRCVSSASGASSKPFLIPAHP